MSEATVDWRALALQAQRERDEAREMIALLVDELQTYRTDHAALANKALRVLGLDDAQIRLWFAGELVL